MVTFSADSALQPQQGIKQLKPKSNAHKPREVT